MPSANMMPGSIMPSANMMPGAGSMMPGSMMPGIMMQSTTPPPVPSGVPITPGGMALPAQMQEESYVENILRMNLGKVATLYMTYENNTEWNAKIFKGVLEAAGRDHIIISDPVTGKRYLLLTLNLDYITFDEQINYTLPFGTMPSTR
ncbi:spore coat protein GerQ [Cohnella luojiensis]|uniref:Spore coat protein GerQ n=2 Tax=Cohnella luojiensis TaxID=652876 RepID=A0A4Y8LTZ2_9BACL|nr:spore coat protein GerQ [Cohnella luojiensis]